MDRAHPESELPQTERFGNIVVRTEVETSRDGFIAVQGRQENDGRGRVLPNLSTHFEAIESGQPDVDHDNVGQFALPLPDCLLPVRGHDHIEAFPAERVGCNIEKVEIVVDKQYFHR